jgi:hypothetical protein
MGDINVDTVRETLNDVNPAMEAVALYLKGLSRSIVGELAASLIMVDVQPAEVPAEFLVQAVLVEADRVFKGISRENWIKIYDSYTGVKAVIDAHPELKAEAKARFSGNNTSPASAFEKLLSGEF